MKEDKNSTASVVGVFFVACFGVLLFPFLSRARWNGQADISLNTFCLFENQSVRACLLNLG